MDSVREYSIESGTEEAGVESTDTYVLTSSEDIRLTRIANGDDFDDTTCDSEEEEQEQESTNAVEQSIPPRLESVSFSGRRTTRFVLNSGRRT